MTYILATTEMMVLEMANFIFRKQCCYVNVIFANIMTIHAGRTYNFITTAEDLV